MKTTIYSKTVFNYSKLRGRIREVVGTEGELARLIGMAHNTLSATLNNKRVFTQREISNIARVLNIPVEEYGEYFFTSQVLK